MCGHGALPLGRLLGQCRVDVLCRLGPQPDPLECQPRRPRREGHIGGGRDAQDPLLLGPRSTRQPIRSTDTARTHPLAVGRLVHQSTHQPAGGYIRPRLTGSPRTGAAADDHRRVDNRDELHKPLVLHVPGSEPTTVGKANPSLPQMLHHHRRAPGARRWIEANLAHRCCWPLHIRVPRPEMSQALWRRPRQPRSRSNHLHLPKLHQLLLSPYLPFRQTEDTQLMAQASWRRLAAIRRSPISRKVLQR